MMKPGSKTHNVFWWVVLLSCVADIAMVFMPFMQDNTKHLLFVCSAVKILWCKATHTVPTPPDEQS